MSYVKALSVFMISLGVVASTFPAFAQTSPLQIKLVRTKIVVEHNQETIQSQSTLYKPGEIIEEVATYTNVSQKALKGLEATLPVPRSTELVLSSIRPGNAKASIDGKNFFNMPLVRRVPQPNGGEVDQAVPISEYRYLRWYPGELTPVNSLAFSARFRVLDLQDSAVVHTGADQQLVLDSAKAAQQNAADKANAAAGLGFILGTVLNTVKAVSDAKASNQVVQPLPPPPAYKPPLEVTCTTNGNRTTCRER